MAYYIISIIMTLGLIHIVPIRLRNLMVVLITIMSIFFLFILFVERFFFYSIFFNKLVTVVAGNELTQVLYGALVATLLYYWFSKEGAFDRIHIVGAAAALLVFGFLIPTVERLPERISGISFPIGSITFAEHSSAMTPDPVVTPDRNEQVFGGETQPRDRTIVLSSGLAHPDPDKGHVNRDKEYANVNRKSDLAKRMDKINDFIVDVFQPLVACSDRIRREMGSSHLFNDELLKVAAAFRVALIHEAAWHHFRREYAGAQLRVLQEIGRHNVALKSDGSDTPASICRLVMTALKYPTNPFNAEKPDESIELPYGPIVLALLLYTAGEKDAAKHELERWLDRQENADTAPRDEVDNPQWNPQWFKLRARVYLSDLLSEIEVTPQYRQDIYEKNKNDFQRLFKFIPPTAELMKEQMQKCSQMRENDKRLLFSHITYLNDGLEYAVRTSEFGIYVEDIQRAQKDVEYLSAVEFNCFEDIFDQRDQDQRDQRDMFEANIYMTMAEAYLQLASTQKKKNRIGNQQYRRWLEQAEEQLLEAVPIWSNLARQEKPLPSNRTESGPARDARAQYDKATKWLLEIRRYTRQN